MRPVLILPAILLAACSAEPEGPTVEEQAAVKCPRVAMDKLAGDWVSKSGDPKKRFRVVDKGGETLLWYVDPSFSNHRLELVGTRRDSDWQFDERPRGKRKALISQGGEQLKRVYLAPKIRKCMVDVYAGVLDGEGKETMPAKPGEYVMFPDTPGVSFSYAPFDEPVFLAEAAQKKKVADAELAELGEPRLDTRMGEVVVAAWSEAGADGDASCTFTLDAWFDDQPVEGGKDVPAAEPVDGARAWRFTYQAPYSGNHRFEIVRKRTCGGTTETIAVAGLDAVLQ